MKESLFPSHYFKIIFFTIIYFLTVFYATTGETINQDNDNNWQEKIQQKYKDSELLNNILQREIRPGMTTEMILDMFDKPDDIIDVINPECGCLPMKNWIYRESTKKYLFVTFENDRVILWGWQNQE